MTRVASALIVTGGLLLVWVAARAAQTPPIPPASPAVLAAIEREAPQSKEISDDAARLRAWLDSPPPAPRPIRDPFRFGASRSSASSSSPPAMHVEAVAAPAAPAIVAPPAPPLLRLVAILSTASGNTDAASAIISANDDVHRVKVGDTLAGFRIRSITSGGVEVVDSSGVRTTLVLR